MIRKSYFIIAIFVIGIFIPLQDADKKNYETVDPYISATNGILVSENDNITKWSIFNDTLSLNFTVDAHSSKEVLLTEGIMNVSIYDYSNLSEVIVDYWNVTINATDNLIRCYPPNFKVYGTYMEGPMMVRVFHAFELGGTPINQYIVYPGEVVEDYYRQYYWYYDAYYDLWRKTNDKIDIQVFILDLADMEYKLYYQHQLISPGNTTYEVKLDIFPSYNLYSDQLKTTTWSFIDPSLGNENYYYEDVIGFPVVSGNVYHIVDNFPFNYSTDFIYVEYQYETDVYTDPLLFENFTVDGIPYDLVVYNSSDVGHGVKRYYTWAMCLTGNLAHRVEYDMSCVLSCNIEYVFYYSTNTTAITTVEVSPYSNDKTYLWSYFCAVTQDNSIVKVFDLLDTYGTTGNYLMLSGETTDVSIDFQDGNGNIIDYKLMNSSLDYFRYKQNITEENPNLDQRIVMDNGYFEILVRDLLFDIVLYNSSILVQDRCIIQLPVYEMKISNTMTATTTLNINNTLSYPIVPNEVMTLILPIGNYNVSFVDDVGNNQSVLFNMSRNQLLQLNTSLYDISFGLFDSSGLGLDAGTVRLYINGILTSFSRHLVEGPIIHLVCVDYFNSTIEDSYIDVRTITEYNVYVPVYTLTILNKYQNDTQIIISRDDILFTQVEITLGPDSGVEFRFLAGKSYTIKAYDINGTLLETKKVTLNKSKIVSFGWASRKETLTQDTFDSSMQNTLLFVFMIVAGFSVVSILINIMYKPSIGPVTTKIAKKDFWR